MNIFTFAPSLPSLFLTCLLQVTLLSIIVAPLYLIARRFNANVGAVTAIAGLVGVLLLTLMVASPWPHWEPSRLLSQTRLSIPTTEIAAPAENESLVDSPVVPPETTARNIELESESPLLAAWKAVGESLRAVSSEPVENEVGKATSLSWKAMIPPLLILGVVLGHRAVYGGVSLLPSRRSLAGESTATGTRTGRRRSCRESTRQSQKVSAQLGESGLGNARASNGRACPYLNPTTITINQKS